MFFLVRFASLVALAGYLGGSLLAAPVQRSEVVQVGPVEFVFTPATVDGDPFARELWGEIETPEGRTLRLPAFYAGEQRFAVRARAAVAGEFSLIAVGETRDGTYARIETRTLGASSVRVAEAVTLPPVRVEKGPPARFVQADGQRYFPLGMNLAWAPGEPAAWYAAALDQLGQAGGNWVRIWMAHWGQLNLDWPAADATPLPRGQLDLEVAARWDAIVAAAERSGVYVQLVLQHHGQYSSRVNPNWDQNPWNAANPGGFLARATDFFAAPEALRLTRQKYRYIVARWGYSPAVLAWELFNEVHWTDAIRLDGNEEDVAAWHGEMAAWIRSLDVYHHLVTTSTEDLRSGVYAAADYLQPHAYAANMLAAVRRFSVPPDELEKPVFYGEMGDDHMRLTPAQGDLGAELVPLMWAGLMGEGLYPAQIWEGDKLLGQGRLREFAALSRFVRETPWAARDDMKPFCAVVLGGKQVPLLFEAAQMWQHGPVQEFALPTDGTLPAQVGGMSRILVGADHSVQEGFPPALVLRIAVKEPTDVRLRFATAGAEGATVRARLAESILVQHRWDPVISAAEAGARPAELEFSLPAGDHRVHVENVGKADWVELDAVEFGLQVSALAAVGRRSADRVALWLWQRNAVFAVESPEATAGEVVVPELEPGRWHVTWWDSEAGSRLDPEVIDHGGGTLRLSTPPVRRHAAVSLTREGAAGAP